MTQPLRASATDERLPAPLPAGGPDPAHAPVPRGPGRARGACALTLTVLAFVMAPPAWGASGRSGARTPAPAPAPVPVECRAGEASFFRDEGLRAKVFAALQFNKQLLREQIDVQVNGRVATLSGGVSTQDHVALAGRLAREVSGIECVSNFLHVGPPTPPPARVLN